MSQNHAKGSDMGAAFMGLIGGSLLIGGILYGIVVLTNRNFASHAVEHKAGAATTVVGVPVG